MSKIKTVVSCPIDTYSGYGARSRDFVKALIAQDKYDVKILSQRWGNTRFGYLDDHKEDDLTALIIPQMTGKPDLWIQITVPNEFQPVGTYNIGVTAGIETTICDKSWIEGVNRMNLTLCSSKHSKDVFLGTTYTAKDPQGNVVQNFKVNKPVEVLFEGADLDKYKVDKDSHFDLSSIKESFCYLLVGHWLQGDENADRKNIGFTIRTFLETFKNKPNPPALILKTSHSTSSIMDRELVLDKIDHIRKSVKGSLPNIYLLHGDLSDKEMNELYNHPKVKAMVSHTKGEGFGRPLLEFSLVKKPIIATGWSGHMDFLNASKAYLVDGELEQVHNSAVQKNVILKESQWFKPDISSANTAYKQIFKHYKKWLVKAKQLGFKNSQEYNFETMGKLLGELLDNNVPKFAQQIDLNLPTLDLPKLEKK